MTSPYDVLDSGALPSPSLLIFRDLLDRNLDAMIRIAGGAERIRPHAKTHKASKIIQAALGKGISKHKCATIAEAEMIGRAGASDVLLAYPLVGPNPARFAKLVRTYPGTVFRAVVDDPGAVDALSDAARGLERKIPVLLDLEVGMGRTGVAPGPRAVALYERIGSAPNLEPDGLHAYDGHISISDLEARAAEARKVEQVVLELRRALIDKGLPVPRVVMGGTPPFGIHATLDVPGLECSPGTVVLHDYNYQTNYPDLPFTPAALLLTRVVSRPRPGRLCLDLGYKAVSPDPVGLRAFLPGVPDARFVGQSEEHLVIETDQADRIALGTALLAVPAHVCPTVALHHRMLVIGDGRLVDEWDVTARDRSIGV